MRSDGLFLATVIATILSACAPEARLPQAAPSDAYVVMSKITVIEGKRAEFSALLSGVFAKTNCVSCQILPDKSDSDTLWISETWPSKSAHQASLTTPQAIEALKIGRPMILNMKRLAETQ